LHRVGFYMINFYSNIRLCEQAHIFVNNITH